jgi:hypothetical protein
MVERWAMRAGIGGQQWEKSREVNCEGHYLKDNARSMTSVEISG